MISSYVLRHETSCHDAWIEDRRRTLVLFVGHCSIARWRELLKTFHRKKLSGLSKMNSRYEAGSCVRFLCNTPICWKVSARVEKRGWIDSPQYNPPKVWQGQEIFWIYILSSSPPKLIQILLERPINLFYYGPLALELTSENSFLGNLKQRKTEQRLRKVQRNIKFAFVLSELLEEHGASSSLAIVSKWHQWESCRSSSFPLMPPIQPNQRDPYLSKNNQYTKLSPSPSESVPDSVETSNVRLQLNKTIFYGGSASKLTLLRLKQNCMNGGRTFCLTYIMSACFIFILKFFLFSIHSP